GATGFTGSHTALALLAAGHQIRLFVRDAAKVERVFGPHGLQPSDVVVGDMTDEAAVGRALEGCDGVVHAAALVDLRRASARLVEETNARGVELVVGGAASRGLSRIVYVSSLSVFFVPGGPPVAPDLPIAPATTAYARSKAEAEAYVRRLQDEGAPIAISYPAGICGPDDPGMSDANHAVYSWYRDTGVVTSSGFQCVDVRDVAQLHVELLELAPGPHRYGAAGEMLSWQDLYPVLDSLTGGRVRRFRVPGWLLRAGGSVGDVVKRVYDFNFPLTRDSMEFATQWPGADASRTEQDLGLSFRPAHETYRDTLRWMYRAGHLTADHVGRLAHGS
ncbi:MAG: NAD-dependent epimerase/dehydratase family protein, partial [Myxococcota bacterium]